MGQYNKAVLTTAGENLIAQALAGEIQLNISKAKTSNYAYPGSTDFKSLTDMQGVKQTVSDPVTAVYSDTMIQTRALFSNEEIASTYYIHNIGLYAMDGTEEVLFCIVTAETPDEMPQYNGVASTSYIYNIQNVVQDAAELNITVNPSGTATIQDVLARVDATGGDISETVIETLETTEDKYPIPSAGESIKRFFGKVLAFLRNIRPLTSDIAIYVSTTGSDTTGDGSMASPYASITKALSVTPRDLGGYTAYIYISEGVYNDDIVIKGFGSSGIIMIRLLGNITVNKLTVNYSDHVMCISTTGTYTLTTQYILVSDGRLDMQASVNVATTGYVSGYPFTANKASIAINRGEAYISGVVTMTGNTDVAISVLTVSRAYFGSINGTGFSIGMSVLTGSCITYTTNNISATTPAQLANGGMIINSSGTQIAGITSSGLTCTWGTITGGYVRHGNLNGVAMVTVQLQVTTTTALSTNTRYQISGFPRPAFSVALAYTHLDRISAWMSSSGIIYVDTSSVSTASGFALEFGCTYLTTS